MQEQLLTDRQRTPHRVLLDKKIFAEPPVRPLRQGFFGGSDGSGKLWAAAHAEADGGFGLGGIGGGLRELVQQAHRPAVVLRFDEKGADHAFLGIVPVEKKAEPDGQHACGQKPQPLTAAHCAASAPAVPEGRPASRSQSSRAVRTRKQRRKTAAASQRSRNAASKREMPPKLHARRSS